MSVQEWKRVHVIRQAMNKAPRQREAGEVLMAYIDDVSSRVCARFYEYEGTIPAMDSFERYVRRTDTHMTYRALGEPTVAHHGQLFQVETPIHTQAVLVEYHLDGTMRITHRGQPLRYHAIIARPVRVKPPTHPRCHSVPSTRSRPIRGIAASCPTVTKPWRPR